MVDSNTAPTFPSEECSLFPGDRFQRSIFGYPFVVPVLVKDRGSMLHGDCSNEAIDETADGDPTLPSRSIKHCRIGVSLVRRRIKDSKRRKALPKPPEFGIGRNSLQDLRKDEPCQGDVGTFPGGGLEEPCLRRFAAREKIDPCSSSPKAFPRCRTPRRSRGPRATSFAPTPGRGCTPLRRPGCREERKSCPG